MKKICVIGSLNIDMISKSQDLPKLGETILVDSFEVFIGGGKGANQAIAAAKLGANTMLCGILGDKFFGNEYATVLKDVGIDMTCLEVKTGEYPGIAYIGVNTKGENNISVFSGTNMMVDEEYIDKYFDVIKQYDVFLFQQEIPTKTNLYAMKKLKALGKTIILDPAPAKNFTDEYFGYIDFITPNDTELSAITGMAVNSSDEYDKACQSILDKGVSCVIAKAGSAGAYIKTKDNFVHIPCFKVNAVDSTAAGDSFNAGFAYAYCLGKDIYDSAKIAHAVAGIAVTKVGAQSAMPDLNQVKDLLKENGLELL